MAQPDDSIAKQKVILKYFSQLPDVSKSATFSTVDQHQMMKKAPIIIKQRDFVKKESPIINQKVIELIQPNQHAQKTGNNRKSLVPLMNKKNI